MIEVGRRFLFIYIYNENVIIIVIYYGFGFVFFFSVYFVSDVVGSLVWEVYGLWEDEVGDRFGVGSR